MRQTVYDFLDRSSVATMSNRLDLGDGCGMAIWTNSEDRVRYEAPQNHTFSFMLDGGVGAKRLGTRGATGFPGAICVMPEGAGSDWEITAPIRFLHLYLSDARLRGGFAMTHDCDARRLDLQEQTYVAKPRLNRPLHDLSVAALAGDAMRADAALADLFGALGERPVALRSGLSPYVLRRVDDWIEEHLDQAIRLQDLARLADLSDYHFNRMFRLSRGVPPHIWVTNRRVARARDMLAQRVPIAQIADGCGFSSQSHLTRVFHRHTGLTPAAYRRAISAH